MKFASKLQDILIDLHEITGIQSNLEGLLHMNANINKWARQKLLGSC